MKQNKFSYLWVLQGNYGYSEGWEDLCAADKKEKGALKSIKADKRNYQDNAPEGQYRIISRRENNP